MGDSFFGRNVWRMGRYAGVRAKDGLLEGATEASQYLAEQAVLAGMKKEEITSDWIASKINDPEFIQSFALGTYAAIIPFAGPRSVSKVDLKGEAQQYVEQRKEELGKNKVEDLQAILGQRGVESSITETVWENGKPKLVKRKLKRV